MGGSIMGIYFGVLHFDNGVEGVFNMYDKLVGQIRQ